MFLLAIDSSARAASVSICHNKTPIVSMQIDNGNTHSEQLLPMIENCLSRASLSFSDIDAFACTNGPGSFTGVRIGVSVIKGLAFGTRKPCVPVSTLEALAGNLHSLPGLYCSVMDARRSQVYTALFDTDSCGNLRRITPDSALSLEELFALISEHLLSYRTVYFAGDGYEVVTTAMQTMGLNFKETPSLLRLQNATSVASVAYDKIMRGEVTDANALAPTYLRLPQAERERLQKENHN